MPPSDDVNAGTPPDTTVSDAGDPPGRAAGDGGASKDFPGDRPGARSGASPSGDGALVEECEALVLYVARHGDILDDDESVKTAVTALSQAIAACRAEPDDRDRRSKLLDAYATVTRFTARTRGVNGRSVLDTMAKTGRQYRAWWDIRPLLVVLFTPMRHQRPLCSSMWLFVAALIMQILTGWTDRVETNSDGHPQNLGRLFHLPYWAVRDLQPLLVPFIWGGLGASVFLMKRVSDRLSERAYEEARLKGDGTRIFLGAILGLLVVQIFTQAPGDGSNVGGVNLTQVTLAFVAGLGVKPVYAAFEALVEGVAARISGRSGQAR